MTRQPTVNDEPISDVIYTYQSQAGKSAELPAGAEPTPQERETLRALAARVAALAARPVEQEKSALWRAHNRLEPTRPLLFCDPEIGWNEIILKEHLRCENPALRTVEWALRREIFWGEQMCDDRVIKPFFEAPLVRTEVDWGVHEVRHGANPVGVSGLVVGNAGSGEVGSYVWDAPLRTEADIEKLLTVPRIGIDFNASAARIAALNAIFGDLLPVREKSSWWWTLGLSDLLARFRGLEQMMYDMVDAPHIIHRIMGRLRNGTIHMLDELERLGLLPGNHQGDYVGSGGFGWSSELPQPDFNGQVRTRDMWGFAESQETVSISPRMFAEFILPYQLPLLERFGLNCYGCCEPLDKRWKYVKEIPRLRRVSVSPWADRRKMAEYLEDRYIYSLKPPPSQFAGPVFDEDAVRAGLRDALDAARGCRLEIILKDVTTVGGEPGRVVRWVEIAREEIARW